MKALTQGVIKVTDGIARVLAVVAGVALVWLMLLLVGNIVLRLAGAPLPGVYELVGMLGIFVSGLAVAEAQRAKAHVSIDLVTNMLPRTVQVVLMVLVTIASIALFAQLTTSLVVSGLNQQGSGAVTEALRIPFWPSVLLLAVGMAALVLVLVGDLARIWTNTRSGNPEMEIL